MAISNHRLLTFDGERVTFSYKDYAHGDERRTMTLTAMEFLRRFVQRILPRGFVRIRHSGFLANTCRTARVTLARTVLASTAPSSAPAPNPPALPEGPTRAPSETTTPTSSAPTPPARATWTFRRTAPRCTSGRTSQPYA